MFDSQHNAFAAWEGLMELLLAKVKTSFFGIGIFLTTYSFDEASKVTRPMGQLTPTQHVSGNSSELSMLKEA